MVGAGVETLQWSQHVCTRLAKESPVTGSVACLPDVTRPGRSSKYRARQEPSDAPFLPYSGVQQVAMEKSNGTVHFREGSGSYLMHLTHIHASLDRPLSAHNGIDERIKRI
jgi:hypothetical protein